jgi:glycosyl transferase, family 25
MEIAVINLERSVERRARMTILLQRFGLEFSFSQAVDAAAGKHLAFSNYDPACAVRARGEELTPGEIACFASHYKLWRTCIERDVPMVVMEDDIALSPRFQLVLELARRRIDRFGFMRLEGIYVPPYHALHSAHGFTVVRFRKGPAGAAAYAISSKGARALVDHAQKWRYPVDLYLDRFWEHGLSSIAVLPYPAQQASHPQHIFPSSLESERRAKPPLGKSSWNMHLTRWADELRRHVYLLKHR